MNRVQSSIIRSQKITTVETLFYAFMTIMIAVGLILAAKNEDLFRNLYVVEDGVLEYFTALMLFAVAVVCLMQLLRDRQYHTRSFTVINCLIIALMVFGAGEEISWGQRIFGIEAGEFFLENNRQLETNLHNLSVRGVNINKLIFGKILVSFLVLFYLVLPSLYKRSAKVQALFDRLYIPVPKPHHGIAMLAAGLTITVVASTKRGELNEVCLSIFFFLTILYPQNKIVVRSVDAK